LRSSTVVGLPERLRVALPPRRRRPAGHSREYQYNRARARGCVMAQFDRLLAAMVSNKADALVLEDGDLIKVEIAGQLRPLTKAAVSGAQILALLKEIAPPEQQKHLESAKPATLTYVTGDGAFVIRAMLNGPKWHVVAKIDDAAEFRRVTGQFRLSDLPPEETVPDA